MSWRRAAIALGANLGDRAAALASARRALRALDGVVVLGAVPDVVTAPVGPVVQSDFLNGMVLVRTTRAPEALLAALHAIEAAHGRTRAVPGGPRTLDLDLVWMEGVHRDEPACVVPHPALGDRPWVPAQLTALVGRGPVSEALAAIAARPCADPRRAGADRSPS
ncbi:MAG: 2-amino-4-hydroxy-6-hydroxymethyldihydropteridine diphosphokinase [Gemmatimonadaceae bacterium]|jgi:dihydroneopterin aldolase/2-amino-4-hydroxy-6-hydroxymethyldihydropteridine diphosphokinase|nr:2-amino-4-hydroxy-6-hydroxymethyldihydropteridine diphosphokinase [Gemmatimonadaceae bacterium]